MLYTRRDIGKIALAAVPAVNAFGKINSKVNGVQLGAISYSFRDMPNPEDILAAFQKIGLGEVELMSNHAEILAGLPVALQPGGGRGRGPGGPPPPAANAAAPAAGAPVATPPAGAPPAGTPGGAQGQGRGRGGGRQVTPEQQAAARQRAEDLRKWRMSVSMDKFKGVRAKFADAGIDLRLLCYNMNEQTTDDEIEYAFNIAKAMGVKGITTSTQVSMSKRIAPFAEKHKMTVGYHGHDQTSNPNEFSTIGTFATAMSYSKYNCVNLDIGHFTSANEDAIAYIKEHHARITNLHVKDRKKDHGGNTPWGEGDTPIKAVLQLMRKEKYQFPANIEYEYGRPGLDTVAEVTKCFEYCKQALA